MGAVGVVQEDAVAAPFAQAIVKGDAAVERVGIGLVAESIGIPIFQLHPPQIHAAGLIAQPKIVLAFMHGFSDFYHVHPFMDGAPPVKGRRIGADQFLALRIEQADLQIGFADAAEQLFGLDVVMRFVPPKHGCRDARPAVRHEGIGEIPLELAFEGITEAEDAGLHHFDFQRHPVGAFINKDVVLFLVVLGYCIGLVGLIHVRVTLSGQYLLLVDGADGMVFWHGQIVF